MADLFKGMSQSKFLDSLVTITGKNGHELYDYLMGFLKSEQENDNVGTSVSAPVGDSISFTGSVEEIQKYYIGLGGKTTTANYFGCCIPELVCSHCASRLNVSSFIWYKPTKLVNDNGTIVDTIAPYGVYWENEQVGYLPLQFANNG